MRVKKKMLVLIAIFVFSFICIENILADKLIKCTYQTAAADNAFILEVNVDNDNKIQYKAVCSSDFKKVKDTSCKGSEFEFVLTENVRSLDDCPLYYTWVDGKMEFTNIKSGNGTYYKLFTNYSIEEKGWVSNKVSCGTIDKIPAKIPELTSYIIDVVQVAVPVILIIFGMIDLIKGISSQKEDEIKKGQSILIKRLIIAVIMFFIVAIVKMLVTFVADTFDESYTITQCIECFVTNNCD